MYRYSKQVSERVREEIWQLVCRTMDRRSLCKHIEKLALSGDGTCLFPLNKTIHFAIRYSTIYACFFSPRAHQSHDQIGSPVL